MGLLTKQLYCLLLLLYTLNTNAENILVIESYHQEYPWDASYIKGLKTILGKQHLLDFFQMDTKRLPQSAFKKQSDAAWERYLETKPELVILGDDNALKLLGPRLAKTNTPVVYLGINRNPRDYLPTDSHNFTGVLERPLFKRSIVTVSKILQLNSKKILVLFDSGTTSQSAVAETFKGQTQLSVLGVEAELSLVGDWNTWKNQIRGAADNGYGAIIVGLYHTIRDATGQHVAASEVMEWTQVNTNIPIFGFWDFAVGADKTAGGLVLSGEEQGRMAATITERILAGTPPRRIYPKVAKKGRYLFSRHQAELFDLKIPESIAVRSVWTD
ncbi:ABC transporter substrate-binding protein [Motiliproteus sp. MSK22-1]|uniref:ABC transporter substrate-binding protein n=1 Tax=Motiliproteus sp. MSK22-1 TaxID=1897630 RepID=UPI0009764E8B|nr:ABC transporter substrate binding protein [Motiliproteus sp. MSK22-1]OMH33284.1 hypothetical protein BGP75_13650 [Motiliproteus sp. MSK22-1]